MKHPWTPALLKTKVSDESGEAVDLPISLFPKVISMPGGDIGVGGARLLLIDELPVKEGGLRRV